MHDNTSHTMLNPTTRFSADLQFRGGAWAIARSGLILTVWSPGARSGNVTGEEPVYKNFRMYAFNG